MLPLNTTEFEILNICFSSIYYEIYDKYDKEILISLAFGLPVCVKSWKF